MLPPVSIESCTIDTCPKIDGAITYINNIVSKWHGETSEVTSPIIDASTGKRSVIGSMAQMSDLEAMKALDSAKEGWDQGQGVWPQ